MSDAQIKSFAIGNTELSRLPSPKNQSSGDSAMRAWPSELTAIGQSYLTHRSANHLIRRSFSSVPYIEGFELSADYKALGNALTELREADDGFSDELDERVYSKACYMATALMTRAFPTPRVFTHGPKSVVFNWTVGKLELYMTISADVVSALLTSPDKSLRRISYLSPGDFAALGSNVGGSSSNLVSTVSAGSTDLQVPFAAIASLPI